MCDTKDIRRDIVQFVKEIEKYPCLYNYTIPDYCNRTVTKEAWGKIAKKMNVPELEIKDKWRKIRIAFIRSVKHQYTHQSNRPYYLFDQLKFLLPYVKITDNENEQVNATSFPTEPSPSPDYDHLELRDHKAEEEELIDSEDSEKNDVIEINERPRKIFHKESTRDDVTSNAVYMFEHMPPPESVDDFKIQLPQKRNADCTNIENNPRKMFLLSILPDVEAFTEEEMRHFRRGIISTIDNIMERRKTK